MLLVVEGISDWWLIKVLPEWGMCYTIHLDPSYDCKVISSSGLVGATIAESSSMTMIEAWSFYEEGSVATAFPFLMAT